MTRNPKPGRKEGSEHYFRPEDQEEFRLAQLLLLLEVAERASVTPSIERLGVLDFFSANPFLVIHPNELEYQELVLAGFSVKPLTYASPGHRFVTRRSRLTNDLALLLSYGFAIPATSAGHRVYQISESGRSAANHLSSIYAQAYRASVEMIVKRVRKIPDSKLPEFCRKWLHADPAMLDLLNV
ncbi:ABC-three component system middle component 2 [Streptomyces microflavus]|uniref:ABC-three component system middle component 2 n=1 Tax=Streptomyces microflavus TaxID=1919 RepID=UPI0036EE2F7A